MSTDAPEAAQAAAPAPAEPTPTPAPVATPEPAAEAPAETDEVNEFAPELIPNPKDKSDMYANLVATLNGKVDEKFVPVQRRIKDKHKVDVKMHRVFGSDDAKALVDLVFSQILAITTHAGEGGLKDPQSCSMPAGHGSFELLTAGATKKRTPQGDMIDVPKRWRLKWNPGKKATEILNELPSPPADEPAASPPAVSQ